MYPNHTHFPLFQVYPPTLAHPTKKNHHIQFVLSIFQLEHDQSLSGQSQKNQKQKTESFSFQSPSPYRHHQLQRTTLYHLYHNFKRILFNNFLSGLFFRGRMTKKCWFSVILNYETIDINTTAKEVSCHSSQWQHIS